MEKKKEEINKITKNVRIFSIFAKECVSSGIEIFCSENAVMIIRSINENIINVIENGT